MSRQLILYDFFPPLIAKNRVRSANNCWGGPKKGLITSTVESLWKSCHNFLKSKLNTFRGKKIANVQYYRYLRATLLTRYNYGSFGFYETSFLSAGLLLWDLLKVEVVRKSGPPSVFFVNGGTFANNTHTITFLSCQMFPCLHVVILSFCHMWHTDEG